MWPTAARLGTMNYGQPASVSQHDDIVRTGMLEAKAPSSAGAQVHKTHDSVAASGEKPFSKTRGFPARCEIFPSSVADGKRATVDVFFPQSEGKLNSEQTRSSCASVGLHAVSPFNL